MTARQHPPQPEPKRKLPALPASNGTRSGARTRRRSGLTRTVRIERRDHVEKLSNHGKVVIAYLQLLVVLSWLAADACRRRRRHAAVVARRHVLGGLCQRDADGVGHYDGRPHLHDGWDSVCDVGWFWGACARLARAACPPALFCVCVVVPLLS